MNLPIYSPLISPLSPPSQTYPFSVRRTCGPRINMVVEEKIVMVAVVAGIFTITIISLTWAMYVCQHGGSKKEYVCFQHHHVHWFPVHC